MHIEASKIHDFLNEGGISLIKGKYTLLAQLQKAFIRRNEEVRFDGEK